MTGMLRSVNAVRIFVDDLAPARAFYRDKLELEELEDGPGYLVFGVGPVKIVVEAVGEEDTEHDRLVGRLLAVSFDVASMDAAWQSLRARGVDFVEPPERQPWGGTLAFIRDPAGNVITLVELQIAALNIQLP